MSQRHIVLHWNFAGAGMQHARRDDEVPGCGTTSAGVGERMVGGEVGEEVRRGAGGEDEAAGAGEMGGEEGG